MKVILWMGMSLNGFIARLDNEEDFISHDCWLSWLETLNAHKCLIFGRKTYDVVKGWDAQYLDDLKDFRVIVVTSNPKLINTDGFEVAKSPQEALEILERANYDTVVLTSGADLNSSFANLSLIDEIVINIQPVVIPNGIPLFSSLKNDIKLEFIDIKNSRGNSAQLRYRVIK